MSRTFPTPQAPTTVRRPRRPRRDLSTAFRRGVAVLAIEAYAASSIAAPLNLSTVPLFVANNAKANVLLMFGNSNSMDEDPSGAAVGSASPASKSEIARGVVKTLVGNYLDRINMGLLAYQQTLTGGDPVRRYSLHNSPYDVSYNPANWDPSYNGPRDSTTKKFRIANPSSPSEYVYYNVGLPFYAGSPQGNAFCYSPTANAFNNGENPVSGPWDTYSCYSSKSGSSDAAPGAAGAGYSGFMYNTGLLPTDSDLGQGITDFGTRLSWYDVGPTWFSNGSPGKGYVHVPIAPLDTTQAAKIDTKMGTSQFTTNAPMNASFPLQNAGLTPLDGTVLTAQSYFAGSLSDSAQGGPLAAPPNACGKNFLVLLTNGLPSVTRDGAPSADVTTMLSTLTSSVASLYSSTQTATYVIGFALPYGVNPNQLDSIANAGTTGVAYNANDQATLTQTLNAVFADILARTGSAASVALNGGAVSSSSVVYQARFNSADWSGQLLAMSVNSNGTAGTTVWDAGQVLNTQTPSSRIVLTTKPSNQRGIPFRWPVNAAAPTSNELDPSQIAALNTNIGGVVDNAGSQRLDYLRGSSANEGNGAGQYRTRPVSKLGDIVSSAPAYVGAPGYNYSDSGYSSFKSSMATRRPIVYVGANDGMLHGFDATDGREVLGYVPSGVYGNLSALTSSAYSHRYFVDGPLVSGDAQLSGSWRTLLLAPFGAGARGIAVLDVTDPTQFTEANADNVVRFEYTNANDPDVGHITSRPALVKLNNGRWGVVFGNGYNGTGTGEATLYIVDAADGSLIKKIRTGVGTVGTPNGLAGVAPVDDDGNGTVDSVYAGDLRGNVWKFDVTGNGSGSWRVAFSGAPLFTTASAGLGSIPITVAPEVSRHPLGGNMVVFGTGKYLEPTDPTNTTANAFFGVRDNGAALGASPNLLQQSVLGTMTGPDGNTYRSTSQLAIDWTSHKGWMLPLPESGERSVSDPLLRNGRVIFNTMTPSSAACSAGGTSWLMELDFLSGGRLKLPPFDVNADNKINAADSISGTLPSGRRLNAIGAMPSVLTGLGTADAPLERKLVTESSAQVTGVLESGSAASTRRTGWQQLQ